MKLLSQIADYVYALPEKDIKRYLLLSLGTVTIILALTIYILHTTTTSLLNKHKKTQQLISKTSQIIINNDRMKAKEQELKTLLDEHKDFDLRTFF